jgi:SAM-dependent methyltransferase
LEPTIRDDGELRRAQRRLLTRLYSAPLRPPLAWLYRGDAIECPICSGQFRKFMPRIQPPSRPNRAGARCPRCGAFERHRHLWLFFDEWRVLFEEQLRVLHFAPEPSISSRLSGRQNLDYVAADLNPTASAVRADITRLPFADASFDVIICSHVLEHVAAEERALLELRRVLKPTGCAILLVPIDLQRRQTFEDRAIVDRGTRERAFGKSDHVRVYGRDFPDRVARAGFDLRDASQQARLGAAAVRRYGLKRHDQIFVATPKA